MLLIPLPDNMEEVNIKHCAAKAEINGFSAEIPKWKWVD